MHVRVPQSGYVYSGYLADLNAAWQRAHNATERQVDANEEPSHLADCVRYALIRTSIKSLAGNYNVELVAGAVEVGL
jgi:aerobic-type carbon monoxide dehydrogenase small subunit (CoxS/CutS family)